jgi:hypothetical protein
MQNNNLTFRSYISADCTTARVAGSLLINLCLNEFHDDNHRPYKAITLIR